jgi:phage protein U
MAYLILGDIGFAQLSSPRGLSDSLSISYAEHLTIEGKPLLQYTGDGLHEITLDFLFHADFCQPRTVWDSLLQAASGHKALQLSHGNGLLIGSFVIADVKRTTTYSADDGTLYAFECQITLKEYVDSDPLNTKRKGQKGVAQAIQQIGKKLPFVAKNSAVVSPGNKGSLVSGMVAGNALQMTNGAAGISTLADSISSQAASQAAELKTATAGITAYSASIIQQARSLTSAVQTQSAAAIASVTGSTSAISGYSADITRVLSNLPGPLAAVSTRVAALNSKISSSALKTTTLTQVAGGNVSELSLRAGIITRILPK